MNSSIWIIIISAIIFVNVVASDLENKAKLRAQKLPPCAACKLFVTAVEKRIDETARGKYEGGDTAWEESHRQDYKRSEVRLIEIQEKLCQGIGRGEDQCIINAEEYEPMLEQWWFHKQDEEPDLAKWLCNDQLKLCCPDKHYGTDCVPCEGYPDDICNNNGRCKGSGTRNGSGECVCDKGYGGTKCTECAIGYYESYRDDKKLICSPCFIACLDMCTGPGPKGCSECKSGWEVDPEQGCVDINECLEFTGTCGANQFCINNEGSYSCLECDRACKGCSGDGPDMCVNCADGFTMHQGICMEDSQYHQTHQAAMTRYLTYLGLCFATFIIFNRNTWIAMIIGAMMVIPNIAILIVWCSVSICFGCKVVTKVDIDIEGGKVLSHCDQSILVQSLIKEVGEKHNELRVPTKMATASPTCERRC